MPRLMKIVGLCFLLAACAKQGEGDRCQIDDDCDDGLECAELQNPPRCIIAAPTFDAGVDIDASGDIDGPEPDAEPADAEP